MALCCCGLTETEACKYCLAHKDNIDVKASQTKLFKWNYNPFESQTYTIPVQTAQKLVNCYECEYSYHWTFDEHNTNGQGICKFICRDVKSLDGCTFGKMNKKED